MRTAGGGARGAHTLSYNRVYPRVTFVGGSDIWGKHNTKNHAIRPIRFSDTRASFNAEIIDVWMCIYQPMICTAHLGFFSRYPCITSSACPGCPECFTDYATPSAPDTKSTMTATSRRERDKERKKRT